MKAYELKALLVNDPETLKAESEARFLKLYQVMETLDHYGSDWERQQEADEREERRREEESL